MQAASFLVYTCDHLNKPYEVISQAFDENLAGLAVETTKLMRVQRQTAAMAHTETVRKMLLAFSRDLRVVMLRLASRLQTLRYLAASKAPVSSDLAKESLHVFAPLANRLGIWQIKWEMEDLSFRFLEPETYKKVAKLLDEKRTQRENYVMHLRDTLSRFTKLNQGGGAGRPKHIYSIVKKNEGKSLDFDQVLTFGHCVWCANLDDCYGALTGAFAFFTHLDEFDDYIAKPKANGY
jgi:GTP pyrophosphokinase